MRAIPKKTEQIKVGIVSTVYGVGDGIFSWLEHHKRLGISHVLLYFDHLSEPDERTLAEQLGRKYASSFLSIMDGEAIMAQSWGTAESIDPELAELARLGSSSSAVCARQTLNASHALQHAREQGFDWLVHLDADEWFYLLGQGQGGASLEEHFSSMQDYGLIRYLNHELVPQTLENSKGYFKINPTLAESRLGKTGWRSVKQEICDGAPWFTAYTNGKSAVRVSRGVSASGVHGWNVTGLSKDITLCGPVVLHLHCPSADHFLRKHLDYAAGEANIKKRLFEPTQAEAAALTIINRARAEHWADEALKQELENLHRQFTSFSKNQLELMHEANLLFEANLPGMGSSVSADDAI